MLTTILSLKACIPWQVPSTGSVVVCLKTLPTQNASSAVHDKLRLLLFWGTGLMIFSATLARREAPVPTAAMVAESFGEFDDAAPASEAAAPSASLEAPAGEANAPRATRPTTGGRACPPPLQCTPRPSDRAAVGFAEAIADAIARTRPPPRLLPTRALQ